MTPEKLDRAIQIRCAMEILQEARDEWDDAVAQGLKRLSVYAPFIGNEIPPAAADFHVASIKWIDECMAALKAEMEAL